MTTTPNAWIAAISLAAAQVVLTPSFAGDVYADAPPPPAKVERAPAPRDGYVWGSGHWAWSGKAYYWVDGGWVVQRRHMHWVADEWEPGSEKWHFVPAHWTQDSVTPGARVVAAP